MKSRLQYFPQIDTLRFFAVTMVCLSHWLPNHWSQHLQLGRAGVELFFVISGFLITSILIYSKNNKSSNSAKIKTFYIRRILRIFPAYYFILLLSYLFHSGHFEKAIFWNLAYLSNLYMLSINDFPGIMSHFWSLSVEEHFYLVWPFLIIYTPRKYLLIPIILSAFIGIGSRLVFYLLDYPAIYPHIFSLSCFDAFAIGGIMAYFFLFKKKTYLRVIQSNWLLLLSAITFFTILFMCVYFPTLSFGHYVGYRTVFSVLAVFVIGRSIVSRSPFLNHKYLIHLGKISYSMYLFHNFVPGFLLGVPFPANIYLRLIMYFIVLIIVSHISYKLIESPFNRLKKHFKYSV